MWKELEKRKGMEKNEYEHVTVDKLDLHDESINGIKMRDIDEVYVYNKDKTWKLVTRCEDDSAGRISEVVKFTIMFSGNKKDICLPLTDADLVISALEEYFKAHYEYSYSEGLLTLSRRTMKIEYLQECAKYTFNGKSIRYINISIEACAQLKTEHIPATSRL